MGIASTIQGAADWTVGLINPKRHAFRMAMRRHLKRMKSDPEYCDTWLSMLRARGYRAAKSSPVSTQWFGGSRSADAEILQDLPTLRNRSREINRDDPIGSGLTGTFVDNVVGTGFRVQARTGNDDKNRRMEAVWKDLRDNLAPTDRLLHTELQQMTFQRFMDDGEVFTHEVKRTPDEPVWFEFIEGERVANPIGAKSEAEGGEIRDGIERDADGVVVAYWVSKGHPGDVNPMAATDSSQFERLPADTVRHLKQTERPGQSRGVPMFHAILQDLRDLDLLILASLKRVQISACLAVFIQSEGDLDETVRLTAEDYGYRLEQNLEPGMLFRLFPGESVEHLIPNFPTPELTPFIIMLARRIGAALGVSWQIVLKDFGDSTYSSARTDLLESRRTYKCLQSFIIDKDRRPEWTTVMTDAQLRGDPRMADVTSEDIQSAEWIGNGWQWVDPEKSAKAVAIMLELGLTTLQIEAAERGYDWEELLAQRQIEIQREIDAGLRPAEPATTTSGDGARTNGNGTGRLAGLLAAIDTEDAR